MNINKQKQTMCTYGLSFSHDRLIKTPHMYFFLIVKFSRTLLPRGDVSPFDGINLTWCYVSSPTTNLIGQPKELNDVSTAQANLNSCQTQEKRNVFDWYKNNYGIYKLQNSDTSYKTLKRCLSEKEKSKHDIKYQIFSIRHCLNVKKGCNFL